MAVWRITTDVEQDLVTLVYYESTRPGGAPPKVCGRGGLALLANLEGWCAEQATPWDLVHSDRGVFVRLAPPGPAYGRA